MASKTCVDCGVELTSWNRNWGSPRCTECMRVPLNQSKAFFEKAHITEKEIQDYPIASFMGKLFGYVAILLVVVTLGAMIGYSNARSLGGLGYSFLGGMLTIYIFRRFIVARNSVNPLDTQRWYHFAIVFSLTFVLTWTIAYMGFMPTGGMLGGSLFSFHVRITPTIHIAAFWLVTLISIAAGGIGGLIGYFNIVRSDKHDKAVALIHYQRWKQAN